MEATYKVLIGDCIEQMRTLPDSSVHMIATSPPYWGLRDYGCDGQIGLESTPEEFVARLVDVFREARRVLRNDGVCWVNLGDSYFGGGYSNHDINGESWKDRMNGDKRSSRQQDIKRSNPSIKPKDLVGIPWRVAFALQADGWWLRQDVIWAKPNPMPESVTDRCTKAHEYVFLLAKSARYFYDAEAVKEQSIDPESLRPEGRSPRNRHAFETTDPDKGRTRIGFEKLTGAKYLTRNRRSVWTIATAPYKEAHFATWPPKLVEPMIRAGTSERGCCAACGAQWVPVVESSPMIIDRSDRTHSKGRTRSSGTMVEPAKSKTTGWKPSCQCSAGEPVPCTVLDPFGGSGTTLGVANALGRHGIACELNPKYAAMMPARVRSIVDAYYGREKVASAETCDGQLSLFE